MMKKCLILALYVEGWSVFVDREFDSPEDAMKFVKSKAIINGPKFAIVEVSSTFQLVAEPMWISEGEGHEELW